IVAACTIIAADNFHMPVSTTHVLSSGIAGTMMANGSGLQLATIRNIALAWVFTLPVAALLAGGIFWGLRQFLHYNISTAKTQRTPRKTQRFSILGGFRA